MQRWLIALALSLSLAPAALAGGIHARIEGPGPDGVTYTVRTYSCNKNAVLEPWGYAEGAVDGRRKSVLLRFKPTGEFGVYRFTRTWPREGAWMIRYCVGHPPAPATVATLRADGTVEKNELFYKTDGSRECHEALKKTQKLVSTRDDC